MRQPLSICAVCVCLLLGGCGSESPSASFASALTKREQVVASSSALPLFQELQAQSGQTGPQAASAYTSLAAKTDAGRSSLAALRPPARAAKLLDAVLATMRTESADMRSEAAALGSGDTAAAGQAASSVVVDTFAFGAANIRLQQAVGIRPQLSAAFRTDFAEVGGAVSRLNQLLSAAPKTLTAQAAGDYAVIAQDATFPVRLAAAMVAAPSLAGTFAGYAASLRTAAADVSAIAAAAKQGDARRFQAAKAQTASALQRSSSIAAQVTRQEPRSG